MNFKIGTLVYSVSMIPGLMVISLECTDKCARERKFSTVSSAELNAMPLNLKLSKVVSHIQDNKFWERIYVLLKLLFPCLQVLCIADSNKSGMEKVPYYTIMKNISIIK